MDLAIWQNGLEKQVKSIRQNTQENILYQTQANISFLWRHHHRSGHTLEFKQLFDKRAHFHLMCEFMTKIMGS